ncbi:ABC transporter ATP-binding protein [Tersicoccus solisilvae]|uniref:ABC transporter ATP-binding protein n=1 Tax=Tersicoccus solisilvae TaxID=1882339 RepID=A0ABQ1PK35_9MICC|nr:ABC transporter ATP-binding protein [Tersicoccus solisilvae]GGC98599.1 ABC transporter ATP-binding protein [Tersicoccus solisilvae]
MLTARHLSVAGRHGPLLPPTSLTAEEGVLHLAVGRTTEERTALALTLSGRMRPDGGAVMWGHDDAIGKLRARVGLVDSPGVNEPERHQRMRDVIAEDLSLLPKPIRQRPAVRSWAIEHGHRDALDRWPEQLDAASRLRLLADLALADDRMTALVFDGPDRLTFDDAAWLDVLSDYASHGLVVVAVVTAVPPTWDGPLTVIGADDGTGENGEDGDTVPGFIPGFAEIDADTTTHQPTADPAKDDR